MECPPKKTQVNAHSCSEKGSYWSHAAVGRHAGGFLTAKLCDFDLFCLLVVLCAVIAVLECSVFWHHGVQCVGVLANRTPRGLGCQTTVEDGLLSEGRGLMQRATANGSSVCWAAALHSYRGVLFLQRKVTHEICSRVMGFPLICSFWSISHRFKWSKFWDLDHFFLQHPLVTYCFGCLFVNLLKERPITSVFGFIRPKSASITNA